MNTAIDTTHAPRIWKTVGPDMKIRVIDPKWLADQQALERSSKWGRDRNSFERTARRICQALDVSKADLFGRTRSHRATLARMAVMYWARRRTGISLIRLGQRLGRDHTTVLSGIRRYPELRAKQGRHLKSLAGPSKTMRQQERGA